MVEKKKIDAFILAAGLGKRMEHLTDDIPKPLVKVNNKPLIEYSLEHLINFGIDNLVINLHYKSKQLKSYLNMRSKILKKPVIKFSLEDEKLLDTGGGIAKGLKLISSNPFFILNSDTIRVDRKINVMNKMIEQWDPKLMDFLLLLFPLEKAKYYSSTGDFLIDQYNCVTRAKSNSSVQYIYTGLCLSSISNFEGLSGKTFSINKLWDESIKKKKLHGLIYSGDWLHVGTPEELIYAEKNLKK
ncbi:MAG: D-glycero-alpha-D-manno-heptose 1-phosphate guanylyltransferase [Alphaproteobacteria bacterium MarineAlpha2_Bin1]|nr:MAG: D-glycero-alpha-D-manno-heptose 1-phosphate guanylyltransferase [Alphaproteobacteria bacterium MarineAlpha2_Bin1]|tara:strand:+ start:708 stop:1436 length:729 start_codon:yes stop_codon:yes gene_type:complete